METPPPPPCKLNLNHVISVFVSDRFLTTKYVHFTVLSFPFLPLIFYLITAPILILLFGQILIVDHIHAFPHNWGNVRILNYQNSVIPYVFYILILYFLSLCAISTIIYNTHHGCLSGYKPVNFFTAIKSLTSTFFRIVITTITAHILIFLYFLSYHSFVQTNLKLVHNLGFVIDYNSNYFIWFSYVIDAISIVNVTYFLVDWSLAYVVVVVESKSGFSALKRSSFLVKGMRSVSLFLFLFFAFFLGISVLVSSETIHKLGKFRYVWYAMMVGFSVLMSYMTQWTAATTVLYNYCKVFHGELGFDEKIPDHVIEVDDQGLKVLSMESLMLNVLLWFCLIFTYNVKLDDQDFGQIKTL